jgi:hypothetical protein
MSQYTGFHDETFKLLEDLNSSQSNYDYTYMLPSTSRQTYGSRFSRGNMDESSSKQTNYTNCSITPMEIDFYNMEEMVDNNNNNFEVIIHILIYLLFVDNFDFFRILTGNRPLIKSSKIKK